MSKNHVDFSNTGDLPIYNDEPSTSPAMSDIETKLREALDGVTPGPWHLQAYNGKPCDIRSEKPRLEGNTNIVVDAHWASDTKEGARTYAYIALCSPDNIGALLDTIAALSKQVSDAVGESHQRHVDWNELVLDAERDFTAIVDAHMPGLARRLAREALERIRAAKPTLATLTGGKAE